MCAIPETLISKLKYRICMYVDTEMNMAYLVHLNCMVGCNDIFISLAKFYGFHIKWYT